MADVGIYTKNADIQARAGIYANTTSKATAATDVYVLDIESMINVKTRYNWSDAYTAGLNADVQGILTHTSACWCAMIVIQSDMSGYTSRAEAKTMLDFLNNEVNKGISFLKEKGAETFMIGA